MCDAVEKFDRVEDFKKRLSPIKAITPEQVKAAVQNPVAKLRLSPILERNRKQIISNIKREIGVGLTNGDRMATMARRISKCVNGDYNKAMLIARTEGHRVREKGLDDSAARIDSIMQDNGSEYRMVKIWKTMRDMSVRHTNLANHVDMEGQTVLEDEDFTLTQSGAKAKCPGCSGIAAEDCNCRCRVTHRIMSDAEFFKATGRHFPGKDLTDDENDDTIVTVKDITDKQKEYEREISKLEDEYKRKYEQYVQRQDEGARVLSTYKRVPLQERRDVLARANEISRECTSVQTQIDDIVKKMQECKDRYTREIRALRMRLAADSSVTKAVKTQSWVSATQQDGLDAVMNVIDKADDTAQKFWVKYGDLVKGNFYNPTGKAYYSHSDGKVYLNLDMIDERSTRIGETKDTRVFFHETGHLFDYNVLGNGDKVRYHLPDLKAKLEEDALNYVNNIRKQVKPKSKKYTALKRLNSDVVDAVNADLRTDPHIKNAVSDIFSGLTNDRLLGRYHHIPAYWKQPETLEAEAIAHMFECTALGDERLSTFRQYFPTAYDYFLQYIKTLI